MKACDQTGRTLFFVSVTVAYNNCGIFKKWIICRFDCEHIYLSIVRAHLETSGRDRLLIVKLNKTYTGSPTERIYQHENLYEKTRKYWKLNPEKAQQADFVFAVFKKVVRAVYKPERWFPVQNEEIFSGIRYAFDGVAIENSPYLNKDVSKYIRGMNPIQYINI